MTEPEAQKPLPREAACRIVEDAEVRGLPVVLSGGETWYVAPIALNPRGQRLAELMDSLTDLDTDSLAAEKGCSLAQKALEAAETEEAVEAAATRLKGAAARLRRAEAALMAARSEVAYHALRSLYRVTREESDVLVNQRHWGDVVAAVNGRDTSEVEQARALRLVQILKGQAGLKPEDPFVSPTRSAGAASS